MTTGSNFPGGDLLIGAVGFGLAVGVTHEVGKSVSKSIRKSGGDSAELASQKKKNAKLKQDISKYKEKSKAPPKRKTKAKTTVAKAKAKTTAPKGKVAPKRKTQAGRGKKNIKRR